MLGVGADHVHHVVHRDAAEFVERALVADVPEGRDRRDQFTLGLEPLALGRVLVELRVGRGGLPRGLEQPFDHAALAEEAEEVNPGLL